jgi:transposase-like protein
MAKNMQNTSRETFWRRVMADFQRSGLSVREFCRRRKLHESAFYFWRRTIQQRNAARPSPRQCRPNRRGGRSAAFVPLVLDNMHAAAGITLELRGGRALRLSESFPVERLVEFIFALEVEGRT